MIRHFCNKCGKDIPDGKTRILLRAKMAEVDWLEVRRIQDEWQGRLNWLKMI